MKNFVSFLAIMLIFVSLVIGAPITSDTTVCSLSSEGTTSCGYFGTYKDKDVQIGIEMGLNWVEGSKTTTSFEVNYVGGYAYDVMFGSSWTASKSVSLNKREVVGFFNDLQGQASEWRSTNSVKTVSASFSSSSWNCEIPTACHEKGIWEVFTAQYFFGEGWWKSYLDGVEAGSDKWRYSEVVFSHDSGAWSNTWDSTGGAVPEPSTYAMMGLGLAALGLISRRKKS